MKTILLIPILLVSLTAMGLSNPTQAQTFHEGKAELDSMGEIILVPYTRYLEIITMECLSIISGEYCGESIELLGSQLKKIFEQSNTILNDITKSALSFDFDQFRLIDKLEGELVEHLRTVMSIKIRAVMFIKTLEQDTRLKEDGSYNYDYDRLRKKLLELILSKKGVDCKSLVNWRDGLEEEIVKSVEKTLDTIMVLPEKVFGLLSENIISLREICDKVKCSPASAVVLEHQAVFIAFACIMTSISRHRSKRNEGLMKIEHDINKIKDALNKEEVKDEMKDEL